MTFRELCAAPALRKASDSAARNCERLTNRAYCGIGKREELVREERQELNKLAVIMQILHNTKTRFVLWNLIESQNMVFWAVVQNLPV